MDYRKIFYTVLIFLFATLATGNAQFFKDDNNSNQTAPSAYSGGSKEINNSGGLFRNDSPSAPGTTRPGLNEGIGMTAPLGDGIKELIFCCTILALVIFYKKIRKRKNKNDEKSEDSEDSYYED